MIETLIEMCRVDCRGGFVAYWNDSPLYPSDPSAMFSRAIAVLLTTDGRFLVRPIDLTQPDPIQSEGTFRFVDQSLFGTRSTGPLFFKGCYFSIRSGDLAGPYQISEDLVKSKEFPNARAYLKRMLQGSSRRERLFS